MSSGSSCTIGPIRRSGGGLYPSYGKYHAQPNLYRIKGGYLNTRSYSEHDLYRDKYGDKHHDLYALTQNAGSHQVGGHKRRRVR